MAALLGTAAATVATASERAALPRQSTPADTTPLCPVPAAYRGAFVRAARDTGLPLAMLVAVGRVESNFQSGALSRAGARGLLQVLPSTADELDLDASRPETNVLAGARYLRQLLDEFHSTDLALAAYNAGPTAVSKAGGAPSTETWRYVVKVTTLWRDLRGCR